MKPINLPDLTRPELLALARRKKIIVTTRMRKDELIQVLRRGLRALQRKKKKVTRSRASSIKLNKGLPVAPPDRVEEDLAAKFILGPPEKPDASAHPVTKGLPQNYGTHQLVLMARDPYWVFLYWELQEDIIREKLAPLNGDPSTFRWYLRVHCVESPSPESSAKFYDTETEAQARNWYLHLSPPGAAFQITIGAKDASGKFAPVAESNTVALPPDRPSSVIDASWDSEGVPSGFDYPETRFADEGPVGIPGGYPFSSISSYTHIKPPTKPSE